VVVAGDSTSEAIAKGLARYGAESGKVEVIHVIQGGCSVLPGDYVRIREGMNLYPPSCSAMIDQAASAARQHGADAIAVFLGSMHLADWRVDRQETWRSILEADIGARLDRATANAVGRLVATGVPVLWADLPQPDFDIEAYSRTFGIPVTGGGPSPLNEPARTREVNRRTSAVVSAGGARYFPFAGPLAGPDGVIEDRMRSDGLHLWDEVAYEISKAWLAGDLRAAVGLPR
jgi:hypothetical protein